MTILNAPTKLMGAEGYGEGYIYDHDTPEGFSGQEYFPEKLGRQQLSTSPSSAVSSARSAKRLDYWQKLQARAARGKARSGSGQRTAPDGS